MLSSRQGNLAERRTTDGSPSPGPVSTPKTEAVASEQAIGRCHNPVDRNRLPAPRPRQHGTGDQGEQPLSAPRTHRGHRYPAASHTATTRADCRAGAATGSSIRAAGHRGTSGSLPAPAPAVASPPVPRRRRHRHLPHRPPRSARPAALPAPSARTSAESRAEDTASIRLFSLATKRPTTGSTRVQLALSGHG